MTTRTNNPSRSDTHRFVNSFFIRYPYLVFLTFESMSKRYTLLLSFVCLLFFSLYALLCYYSRLATDDYFFISDVRSHGVITGVISQYMEWCGRYAATFVMDVLFHFLDVSRKWYFLWPAFTMLLLLMGVYNLAGSLAFQFKVSADKKTKALLSVCFVILLFFSSVDIGETWMWYCDLTSYLWSVIAFIWACSFIFGNYKKYFSIIFSSLCFIYAGGSSEVYSVIYGVILLLFMIYQYKQYDNFELFLEDPFIKRLFIPYAIFAAAFFVFLVAPGNYLRDQLFPEHHIGNALFITCKSIIKFAVLYVPFRLVYVIAFAVPFIVAGNMLSTNNKTAISFQQFFKYTTILFLSLALLFFLLVAYVMVETGPPRLWFILSFLFSSYVTALCFYAGYSGFINESRTNILRKGSIVTAILVLGYNLWHQSLIVPKYAAAHDARVAYVTELNKTITKDTIISLTPLPSSGMVYSSEIKADTNHFTNKELRLGYNLKFHVVCE